MYCKLYILHNITCSLVISLGVWWSELPTTNNEIAGSIPGSAVGIPIATMVWVACRI
jgi:hypothetical protein